MARLTIEDCLQQVGNRYSLVLLASQRARQLSIGVPALVEEDPREKPTVTALREIAAGKVTRDNIDSLVSRPTLAESEHQDEESED